MRLLKNGVPFYWDELAQRSFDALKKYIVSTPLHSPLDYNRDSLLYLEETKYLIGMVLFQEVDKLQEHIIYYLSCSLIGPELKYSHIKKLALASFHVVQCLWHYILLCKTTFIANVNPFQYVLNR
jgi:hypothetical protein